MNNDSIINKLKQHPSKSLLDMAYLLNISVEKVRDAQLSYYKRYIDRDSPLWGAEGCAIDERNLRR